VALASQRRINPFIALIFGVSTWFDFLVDKNFLASFNILSDLLVSIPAISSNPTAKSRNLVTNSSVTAIFPEV
jgi:hypothetical protein